MTKPAFDKWETLADLLRNGYALQDGGPDACELGNRAAAMLEELHAAPPAKEGNAWQPITSAPKDKTEFIAWLDYGDLDRNCWAPRCRYDENGVFQLWDEEYEWEPARFCTPTHWLILEPPK